MRTCLYSDIALDLSVEEINNIFQKVFGTSRHTAFAENYIREKDCWCVLDCDDCVFGYSHSPLQFLTRHFNVVFLSQVIGCSIGEL